MTGFQFSVLSRKEKPSICYPVGLEESIRLSITTILATATGERPLDPDFGCNLHKFIYARLDDSVLREIASDVQNSLARCEPRILILEVLVARQTQTPSNVEIEIHYKIRQNNIAQSVVVPLSLLE